MIALATQRPSLLDEFGRPMPRSRVTKELAELDNRPHRSRLSYDSASDSNEYKNIWAKADAFDADSANDRTTRYRLMHRSRYEAGSNGYYAGILTKHVNMLIGVGPTLRMLTDNPQFNRTVEREWYYWCLATQFSRKLWCMAHAKTMDGETFGLMVTNPTARHAVQLDVLLIEPEQVQTPYLPTMQVGYIDGIKFDEFGNPEWYDVLPQHPGSLFSFSNQKPTQVPAGQMLHWFKMRRPGQHRGIPDCTPTLNLGAAGRRLREAVLAAHETAAEPSLVLETQYTPDELDNVTPLTTIDFQKRMIMALPNNMRANQIKAEHPNAQYREHIESIVAEQASPLTMPLNAALGDSSNYSFASGKLDNILYYAGADVERKDINELILDKLFAEWYREFVIASDARRGEGVTDHQWDWPAHPVIDEVAHATANQKNLSTGQTTLSRVYTDDGNDFQDGIALMAEEWFGEATDANIAKARTICVLRNTPAHAINQVAAVMGVAMPKPAATEQPEEEPADAPEEQVAA